MAGDITYTINGTGVSAWDNLKVFEAKGWEMPIGSIQPSVVDSGAKLQFVEGPDGSAYAVPPSYPGANTPIVFKTHIDPGSGMIVSDPWSFAPMMAVGKPTKKARFEPRFPINVSRAELLAFIRGLNWGVTCPIGALETQVPNEDVRKFLVRQNENIEVVGVDTAKGDDKTAVTDIAQMFDAVQYNEVLAQASDKVEAMLAEAKVVDWNQAHLGVVEADLKNLADIAL